MKKIRSVGTNKKIIRSIETTRDSIDHESVAKALDDEKTNIKENITMNKEIKGTDCSWKKEDEDKLKKLFGLSIENEIKKVINNNK